MCAQIERGLQWGTSGDFSWNGFLEIGVISEGVLAQVLKVS
jgi:hypothetical protein